MCWATPSGLSNFSLRRSSSERCVSIYASSSGKPVAARALSLPLRRALKAFLDITPKTCGVSPSVSLACSRTKPSTCSRSCSVSRISSLFTTMVIFLPQALISFRKVRSLSVKGRSALVTKRTKSARGMNFSVSSWCLAITALVPGVSTRASSCRACEGKVRRTRPEVSSTSLILSP